MDGVVRTKVGYSGGSKAFPTYYNLADHAESIEIEFDPNAVDYNTLLNVFWEGHNPTALVKRQYMSAIFYHNEDQKQTAEKSLEKIKQKLKPAIVRTEIMAAGKFYDAEDYHQKYILRQQRQLFGTLNLSDEQVKLSPLASKLTGYLAGYGGIDRLERVIDTWDLTDKQKEMVTTSVKKKGCTGMFCSI
ncbi:peptide methionine sulfoxide reductase-like [Rhopilema esculentum]|uniref:peptide methionine sulfoxide reductase-like n=1 Tax=Rhopilema esculentum TaxID=499914 RepID=UPI0031D48902